VNDLVRIGVVLLMGAGLVLGGCKKKDPEAKPAEEPATAAAEEATPEEPATPAKPVVKGGGEKGIPKPALRDVDKAVSEWLGQDVGAGRHDDVDPDAAWRIDLVQAEGATYAGSIEVDLDRDGNVDEVWAVEGSSVTREVSPDDDGNRTKRYGWIMGNWIGM